MNEAEAHVLRDIIRTTVRETISAELVPVRQWLDDLTDKTLKLAAAVDEQKSLVEMHTLELRKAERASRELAPRLERCIILTDQLVPQMARALDRLDAAQESDAELRQSLTDIEEAGTGKRASVGP